jgi:ferredoxin
VKIVVQQDACVGSGQCALVAGSLFDQDDDGIVMLLNSEPSEAQERAAITAASLCPARAISVGKYLEPQN